MKINLSNPGNDYTAQIDTSVMDVLVTEAYLPCSFVSDNGEELHVVMRDQGFELIYVDTDEVVQTWSLNDGFVKRLSIESRNAR